MRRAGPRLAGLVVALLVGAATASAQQRPLWIGWVDGGRQVVPLGRFHDGAWSNPFPARWLMRDPHDPCPEKHRIAPEEWWGRGGTPSLDWVGWTPEGPPFPLPLSGRASTTCDYGSTYWTLDPVREVAPPDGRTGYFSASEPLALVPPIELPEDSTEAVRIRAGILPEIARLERLTGKRASNRKDDDETCLPDPPLSGLPDLAVRIVRSLVPVDGAFLARVEAWNPNRASPLEVDAIGPEESFVTWLVECDGRIEIVSRRFRFALRDCPREGGESFFAFHPSGFFELAGRRYALARESGEASELFELIEIRADGVRTILSQGRGGD